jgi:hypothetical protein
VPDLAKFGYPDWDSESDKVISFFKALSDRSSMESPGYSAEISDSENNRMYEGNTLVFSSLVVMLMKIHNGIMHHCPTSAGTSKISLLYIDPIYHV